MAPEVKAIPEKSSQEVARFRQGATKTSGFSCPLLPPRIKRASESKCSVTQAVQHECLAVQVLYGLGAHTNSALYGLQPALEASSESGRSSKGRSKQDKETGSQEENADLQMQVEALRKAMAGKSNVSKELQAAMERPWPRKPDLTFSAEPTDQDSEAPETITLQDFEQMYPKPELDVMDEGMENAELLADKPKKPVAGAFRRGMGLSAASPTKVRPTISKADPAHSRHQKSKEWQDAEEPEIYRCGCSNPVPGHICGAQGERLLLQITLRCFCMTQLEMLMVKSTDWARLGVNAVGTPTQIGEVVPVLRLSGSLLPMTAVNQGRLRRWQTECLMMSLTYGKRR